MVQDNDRAILREYVSVIWRRKWAVLLVTVIAAAVLLGVGLLQAQVYEARADLIYEQQLDVANPLTGQSYSDPTVRTTELSSVNAIIQSPTMTQRVATILTDQGLPTSGYEVRAQVAQDLAGTGTQSTNVVSIFATSGEAEYSAAVAQAYADSFVDWRMERMLTQIEAAESAIRAEIRDYPEAAKESSDFIILQQRLRDLQILAATATGNFRVLVPASIPAEPIEPRPLRSALLGMGIGLLLGIGVAFLLEQLDTSVRSDADIAEYVRLPILARIPRISKKLLDHTALVTLSEPDGTSAEAFRMLRTNLSFMSVDGEVRSVLLTSCLQGEGKSVTIANLAVTLALGGKRVIVVDADLRRPRMHNYFRLDNEKGVSTVVSGQTPLSESVQAVSVVPASPENGFDGFEAWTSGDGGQGTRLYVLTSGPTAPNPGEIVSSRRFGQLIDMLAPKADIVLVDSPAMLAVGDTAALADKVDGLLFLVEPDVVRRQQLIQAREQLDKLPCTLLGLIIARRKASGAYYAPRYYYRETADGQRVRGGRAAAASKTPESAT
jgi:non-specific protein-tyrosine kinase